VGPEDVRKTKGRPEGPLESKNRRKKVGREEIHGRRKKVRWWRKKVFRRWWKTQQMTLYGFGNAEIPILPRD
tara:strand:- start:2384 stop:2599 length:216 start_codon:yes stop_codon:yes gene_type:complete